MNTTFLLSGGAGRIITAIPALENFHQNNPEDDFKVLIYGWDNLYLSHPILQNRTYDANMRGVFGLIIKDSNLVVPEPYHNYEYYNQQISLAKAFDYIINSANVTVNLVPNLYLHSNEDATARMMIEQAKTQFKKARFVVFQPYGSGINDELIDTSGRSLNQNSFEEIANFLSKEMDAVVLFFGDIKHNTIHDERIVLTTKDVPGADLRFYMSMIANCDYFVGVDSVGQHMARAFNKPGTVLMGSTHENNVTYTSWFKTYRKSGYYPSYNPIRISIHESELCDRINDGIMNFSKQELNEIFTLIKDDMNEK